MPTVLPFRPESMTVSLEWLTQVHEAYNAEKRDQLRLLPRISCIFTFELDKVENRFAQSILEASSDDMCLPDWRYEQFVTLTPVTTNIEFTVNAATWPAPPVGDRVLFWHDTGVWHISTITGVAGATITVVDDIPAEMPATGVRAIPLYDAVIRNQPQQAFIGNTSVELTVTLEASAYLDLTAFAPVQTMYRNNILFDRREYRLGNPTTVSRLKDRIRDNDIGPLSAQQVFSESSAGRLHTEVIHNQSDMLRVEGLFHLLAGRVRPFYKPSWLPDFTLAVDAAPSATQLLMELNPDADLLDVVTDILVQRNVGAPLPLQVQSVSRTAQNLIFTLEEPLDDAGLPVANVSAISKMELHRLDSDVVRMDINSGISSSVSLRTKKVPG